MTAINSIGKGSSKSLQDLVYDILLAEMLKSREVEISSVWVPARVRIATNEKVDKLAKEAAQKEIIDVNINLSKVDGKSIVWQEINKQTHTHTKKTSSGSKKTKEGTYSQYLVE